MSDDQQVRFSIKFALDKDDFLRRTCPNCGRSFKTQIDPDDFASNLQPTFNRIEHEIGGISLLTDQEEHKPQFLSCPYCNHRGESGDMLTKEFVDYLERYVIREYVLPKINGMLSDFSNDLISTSTSNSFFSLEINTNFDNVLPPRPISGPEPPDMTKVELICCGKYIKISDGWFDLEICPYCETEVKII